MRFETQELKDATAYLVVAVIATAALLESVARHMCAFQAGLLVGDGAAVVVLLVCSRDQHEAVESTIAAHFFALPFKFVEKMSYGCSLTCRFCDGEATLVSDSRQALEQQFNRILGEHGSAISRLAFSYEAVTSVREELLQEIALAIWQALPHFRGECSERTFVFRIAHNRGLSHAWKRRLPLQPLDDLEDADQPIDPRPQPEERAAVTHQRARLMSAIQSLPVSLRQIVVLMLEGLSHAEIAEVMGITENNVAVRMNRARKALKDALGGRQ